MRLDIGMQSRADPGEEKGRKDWIGKVLDCSAVLRDF